MKLIDPEIARYAKKHTTPESSLLSELINKTESEMEYSDMLSGRVEGRLLALLVKISKARNILEIGMFTGFSALIMAEALPDDGKLITCDVNEKYAGIARSYFDRSPHGEKIRILMGNALETVSRLEDTFDLVFLDADKESYPDYYELLLPKLRSGGLMVVDNALWSGEVLDPKERQAEAIDELNKRINADERVENVLLTIRDGIHLVLKK